MIFNVILTIPGIGDGVIIDEAVGTSSDGDVTTVDIKQSKRISAPLKATYSTWYW